MEQLVGTRLIGPHQRHFLAFLLLLTIWLGSQSQASAQQQYNNVTGYVCSDSGSKLCKTFALYRAQRSYSTVQLIAKLFNNTPEAVAKLNNLPNTNQTLDMEKAVFIPVNCICGANSTSFAKIPYTIVKGDTFDGINVNKFEFLSTDSAIEAANSKLDPTNLLIGDKIVFPLRCACPSKSQTSLGVKSLVTYPVATGDTIDLIASSFDVISADVMNGNTGADTIDAETTLLIPINSSQPSYMYKAPPPAAAR